MNPFEDLPVATIKEVAKLTGVGLTSVPIPWREMTQNGINALLNLCYDMKRPVTRSFPVSVALRASLSKASAGRRKAA
jgi:LacI family transcriptional regulator